MKKLGVEIWTMYSDAGYRPSNGRADVVIIPREKEHELSAAASEGQRSLYDFVAALDPVYYITKQDLGDIEPLERRVGVCNYAGFSGTIEYDNEKYIPVAIKCVNISTNNSVHYYAEVLDGDSLRKLYKQRADKYTRLAS